MNHPGFPSLVIAASPTGERAALAAFAAAAAVAWRYGAVPFDPDLIALGNRDEIELGQTIAPHLLEHLVRDGFVSPARKARQPYDGAVLHMLRCDPEAMLVLESAASEVDEALGPGLLTGHMVVIACAGLAEAAFGRIFASCPALIAAVRLAGPLPPIWGCDLIEGGTPALVRLAPKAFF